MTLKELPNFPSQDTAARVLRKGHKDYWTRGQRRNRQVRAVRGWG